MRNLYAGVASIALLWTGQAYAQDQAAGANELGDIIVTAQKRSERLVDVPVSITTVSSENLELAGQESLQSLNKLVPGLYINKPAYFLSPTIRGVGSTLSLNNESAVAVYVDDVYQAAQTSNVFDLASVSGIEVLKGPQGTLFGRNATGGAILVRTLDPGFTTEGKFNLSYGRFNEVRANGYFNLPISDTVAFNTAASYRYSGGYIRDVRTGEITNEGNSFSVRSKLLVNPSDALQIILTGSHTQYDDPTSVQVQALGGVQALAAIPGVNPQADERGELSHDFRDYLRNNAQEYTARIKYDTGAGTLSSITSWRRDKLVSGSDADGTYYPYLTVAFTFRQRTFTQEVNYSSPAGGPFTYVVGAYYFNNRRYYPTYKFNNIEYLAQDNHSEAWAGYADGTYELGDLAIIGGIRYSSEKRRMDNALLAHPLNTVTGSRSIERKESAWTPRFGLRYALGARSNVYATYSKGFKSGAFNGTSLTDSGVTPEKIDAYEIGYKTAGSGFTFNTAAYLYNYKDIQANAFVTRNTATVATLVNAAKARIYGFEVDGAYDFSDAFNIRASFAYTHAKYKSFLQAPVYSPGPGGTYVSGPQDESGNWMVRQPKYQANMQANYTVPVGDNSLTFTLSPSYNSKVYFDFANQLSQKAAFLLDGSVELAMNNGLKLSVYGRNITDKVYFTNKGFSQLAISGLYGDPATYGVKLSYAFK